MNETMSPAEKWVLKQVQSGEVADLQEKFPEKQFPDEAKRVLSARFLEDLLTDSLEGVHVHRKGVQIKHAVLTEPLDLEGAEIPHETQLENCRFEETIIFKGTHFNKNLYLTESSFRKGINLRYTDIAGILAADGTKFTNADKTANFNSMKVGDIAFFRNAVFAGPVNFGHASIGGNFEADGAEFTNPGQEANFNGMKVGHTAFFREAVFAGPVDFGSAEISSQFGADGVQFTNTDKTANFNGMKVEDTAFFRNAVFAGPVNFGGAEISSQFLADGAKFTNANKSANFNSMKMGHTAFFREAVFAGAVDFCHASIVSNFEADGAEFTNADKTANFNRMKVGGIAFFRQAVFAGAVDFGGAEISSQFLADGAKFTNANKSANFDSMKVSGIAFFRDVVFAGPILMHDAEFLDLLIERAKSGDDAQEGCRLDLSRTLIRRKLRIKDMRLRMLVAASLRVEGPALLSGIAIENEASLEHSDFLTLNLTEVSWPDDSESVKLDGIKYQHIAAGDGKDSWEKLLALANLSRYNASVYADLEAFFKRQGHPERANEVFVAQKRRERKEILHGIWRKLGSYFLDYSVRYVRSPVRALFGSGLVMLIGCAVFWSGQNMEPQRAEDAARHYCAFWYSFDLFVPFIDLKAASVWIPKPDCWLALNWMRLQIILGWILIPTGLAAWTGIIK